MAAARLGALSAPGLRVHRNNYHSQLVACLAESFACTRDWIGEDAFNAAVGRHIDLVPPSRWTLDAYPSDFPTTLETLYPGDPEVKELAWLECALGEAFVGPDAEALDPADIADVDWDRAALIFTPTLALGALMTNAPAIWSALNASEVPPPVRLLADPGAILVWRHDQVSCFRAVGQMEYQALLAMNSGMPFAELCKKMVASLGETEGVASMGQFLGQWFADGLVSATADNAANRYPQRSGPPQAMTDAVTGS